MARHQCDTGSSDLDGNGVVPRLRCGSPRKHALPALGARYGRLVVSRYEFGVRGGLSAMYVRCDCGGPEYRGEWDNIRNGKSTQCNRCAKKASHRWRKRFFGYADIVPDEAHRQRLLNRISAAYQRCENPNSVQWPTYGGRGIRVCVEWRGGTLGRREWLAHLVTLPGWDVPGYEMDRADNERGYEPGNLRFVPKHTNIANRRTVAGLAARLVELEAENARLRSRLGGAEESLHDSDGGGAVARS